jgi:Na+-transporting NADH:ubiquinone oxidoreductase subunit F
MSLPLLLFASILTSNIALIYFLGMCPFLALSRKIDVALGMGLAVTFVMTLTAAVNWLIYTWVLVPFGLAYLQFLVFIVTIAMLVQIVEIFVDRYSPTLYQSFGIFLPLITVNCAILGVSLFMVLRDYTFPAGAGLQLRVRHRLDAGHRGHGRPAAQAGLQPSAGESRGFRNHRHPGRADGAGFPGFHGGGQRMMAASLIFINAFALAIGLLILFADRVISNYGVCRITLNGEKELESQGGKSLLQALMENRIFIPSACGGKGTCGYCRLQVTEGGGAVPPTETLILTPEEIGQGYRLSCQLKLRNDMKILVPGEFLAIREYEGEISETLPVTRDIRRMRIRLESPAEIDFKPGQYVQVRVESEGILQYRAYSIASSPDERREIELDVKLIPRGLGSGYLHALGAGDRLVFTGAYGDFFLRTDSGRPIVCVAGGVGLAPMKSIIAWWKDHGLERELDLYYGSRSLEDLYDHETFESLAAENPRFHYRPALTESAPGWQGETGFIHMVLDRRIADGTGLEAYLCGPPLMIDAVIEVLRKKSVPGERIFYDKF